MVCDIDNAKIRIDILSRYDIPVLHVNGIYWAKHRLSAEDATAGIEEARVGPFAARRGEPDASRLEHD